MHTSQENSVKSGNEYGVVSSLAGTKPSSMSTATTIGDYKIIRRNGAVVGFEPSKISIAVTKAFLAVNGGQGAASARVRELVEQLTGSVVWCRHYCVASLPAAPFISKMCKTRSNYR